MNEWAYKKSNVSSLQTFLYEFFFYRSWMTWFIQEKTIEHRCVGQVSLLGSVLYKMLSGI